MEDEAARGGTYVVAKGSDENEGPRCPRCVNGSDSRPPDGGYSYYVNIHFYCAFSSKFS